MNGMDGSRIRQANIRDEGANCMDYGGKSRLGIMDGVAKRISDWTMEWREVRARDAQAGLASKRSRHADGYLVQGSYSTGTGYRQPPPYIDDGIARELR